MKSPIWNMLFSVGQILKVILVVTVLIKTGQPDVFIFMMLAYVPSVLIHELAHAIAFKIVGGTVFWIHLGSSLNPRGKPMWTFRALGFLWHLYDLPLAGAVYGMVLNAKNYRLRNAFVCSAGAIANLSCSFLGMFLLYSLNGWHLFWANSVIGFVTTNFCLFMISIIPGVFISKRGGRRFQTDGLHLVEVAFMTDAQIKTLLVKMSGSIELMKELAETETLSTEELLNRQQLRAQSLPTLQVLIARLTEEQGDQVWEFVEKLLQQQLTNPIEEYLLDHFLTMCLLKNTISQYPNLMNIHKDSSK